MNRNYSLFSRVYFTFLNNNFTSEAINFGFASCLVMEMLQNDLLHYLFISCIKKGTNVVTLLHFSFINSMRLPKNVVTAWKNYLMKQMLVHHHFTITLYFDKIILFLL